MSQFLQTPEFYEQKLLEAKQLIGKHIMVGVTFPGGVVFGKTFNPRSHSDMQWVCLLGNKCNIILAGIGDFRDLKIVRNAADAFENFLDENVGIDELTAVGLSKFISSTYRDGLEEPQALSVETVICDIRSNELYTVFVSSRLRHFSDFVVVGADAYTDKFDKDDLTEEEITSMFANASGNTHAIPESLQKKMKEKAKTFRLVRKPAIEFLKEEIAKKQYEERTDEDAEKLVISALAQFDPQSESNMFEIIIFKQCEDGGAELMVKQITRMAQSEMQEEQETETPEGSEPKDNKEEGVVKTPSE